MKLATQLAATKATSGLTRTEQALHCCRLAKGLEKAGEYEGACEALSEFWPERAGPPVLEGLDQQTTAEVLLRVGAVAGWLGGTRQSQCQETAKDLITRSVEIFTELDEPERVGFYVTPPTDETTARRRLEDIEGQRESEELQKQTRAIVGRPVAALAASFGEGFRDGLLGLPLGKWSVLQSREGWHVVRLDSRRPGALATLDDVRDESTRIWLTDETRKRAWEAVSRLKASYTVRYEQ